MMQRTPVLLVLVLLVIDESIAHVVVINPTHHVPIGHSSFHLALIALGPNGSHVIHHLVGRDGIGRHD